jgi:putative tryptophan/tyrosine transport system substrate-binding protein
MKKAVPRQSRRRFLGVGLALGAGGLLAGCGFVRSEAGRRAKIPRLGLLSALAADAVRTRTDALREGLHELGYVEGRSVALEARYADGKEELMPALAAEVVGSGVDLIVTVTSSAIRPAMNATSSIPIVMVADNADPVAVGYVASLAKPGGNVTGLTGLAAATTQKRLELLRTAVPTLSRVAVLRNPESPDREILRSETEAAARTLGLQLLELDVRRAEDVSGAFAAAVDGRAEGLIVLRDPITNSNRPRIAALAQQHRLPAMYATREFVEVGGLMAYGSNVPDLYRRTATYVDKILKGARPGELPVEQAARFDFVINLPAARAIGLSIPEPALIQATELLQ